MNSGTYKFWENLRALSEPLKKKKDKVMDQWTFEGMGQDEGCNGTCVCGQRGLRYLNHFRNKLNNNETIFGSHCVHKFGTKEQSTITEDLEQYYRNRSADTHVGNRCNVCMRVCDKCACDEDVYVPCDLGDCERAQSTMRISERKEHYRLYHKEHYNNLYLPKCERCSKRFPKHEYIRHIRLHKARDRAFDYVVQFGKYKLKRIREIASTQKGRSWLRWALKTIKDKPEFIKAIELAKDKVK